jgi:hypothetical protein
MVPYESFRFMSRMADHAANRSLITPFPFFAVIERKPSSLPTPWRVF